jgi:nucleoside-diphosphate-sugar epimerase
MLHHDTKTYIIDNDQLILITGAAGFIGSKVVQTLLSMGFRNLRCLVRSASRSKGILNSLAAEFEDARLEVIQGNLLSREDCLCATRDTVLVLHLAAGRGEKSFPDAILNSVVTTRNLLDACLRHGCIKRFVNISSFSVYTNESNNSRRPLDETCPVEVRPELRGEAYCFAKVKQDELLLEYGTKHSFPYVIVRPGAVYGPGSKAITGRVGIDTFGVFFHLGGSNTIPFTYVDNCAEAICLAGLVEGVEGEAFNVVDDDLPSSRRFLRQYKTNVRPFRSIYFPRLVSYGLCWLWESASHASQGQLPPVFNRKRWRAFWKKTSYSNKKLKQRLGWAPRVSTAEGLKAYFEACRKECEHA